LVIKNLPSGRLCVYSINLANNYSVMYSVIAKYKFKVIDETKGAYLTAVISNRLDEKYEAISGDLIPDFSLSKENGEKDIEIAKRAGGDHL